MGVYSTQSQSDDSHSQILILEYESEAEKGHRRKCRTGSICTLGVKMHTEDFTVQEGLPQIPHSLLPSST